MRGYVVTLMEDPRSVEVAKRCVASGAEHGFDIGIRNAVLAHEAREALAMHEIKVQAFGEQYSNTEAVLANFVSQYRAWRSIECGDEPYLICEHDAVITAPMPKWNWELVINVGKPSYGKYVEKDEPGVYPLYSKPGSVTRPGVHFPGAHAYVVSPEGARQLVCFAEEHGAAPVDIFLSTKNFPWLQELSPWIAEAQDTFSTIQKARGCKAKHNFGPEYEHL